jgi:hypothetical protein
MNQSSYFEVRRCIDEKLPKSELFVQGVSTGLIVDGANVAGQFKTAVGDILLILDEDCPFEEMLHFHLVRGLTIIDHLSYGAQYISGIFSAVSVMEDAVHFTFASEEVIAIHVHSAPSRWRTSTAPGARHVAGLLCPSYLSLHPVEK